MSEQQQKLIALIAEWRRESNAATDPEASVTYTECADALQAVIAIRVLIALCEGCGLEVPMPTTAKHRVYADPPVGWTQRGVSKLDTSRRQNRRLANWCPKCQSILRSQTESGGSGA